MHDVFSPSVWAVLDTTIDIPHVDFIILVTQLNQIYLTFYARLKSTFSHISQTLSIDDTPLRAFQISTWFQTILIGSSRCMRERPRVRPRYPPTSATRLKEERARTSFETGTILLNVNSSIGFLLSDFDTRLVCISIWVQGLSQVSYRG